MKISKLLMALGFVLTTILPVAAENNTVTPYSRFGYGILQSQANAAQRGMGSVGVAMRSGRQINFMNPASYAALDTLTFLFDMAGDIKKLKTTEGDLHGTNTTGGLDYIAMQFPIMKRLAASVGLVPYSEVGYSFGDEIVNGTNSRQGSGTLSEAYLGVGYHPLEGLTVGANFCYLFGTLFHDTYVYSSNSTTALFERVTQVRDFNLKLGVQYGRMIGTKNYLTAGLTFAPGRDFHGTAYGRKYDINADTDPVNQGEVSMNGRYSRPASWAAGINWQWNQRLMAEIDFTYEGWKNAKYHVIEGYDSSSKFDNLWRVNLGAQYQIDPRGNYLNRIRYRAGFFYQNDYIRVGSNSVREWGLSCGFGLPAPSSKTIVNLGFEYHHRQASPNPLVKERYFVATLGINFNELWFWKSRIR